jgi:hypothetical protein
VTRREWLEAMRRELDETRGLERLRWAFGIGRVAVLGLVEPGVPISLGDLTPVKPFLDNWQAVSGDPRAAHHAEEIRWNSALGAGVAAAALVVVARKRTRRRSRPGSEQGPSEARRA